MVKGRYVKWGGMLFLTQQKVKRSRSKHAMTMGVEKIDGRELVGSS